MNKIKQNPVVDEANLSDIGFRPVLIRSLVILAITLISITIAFLLFAHTKDTITPIILVGGALITLGALTLAYKNILLPGRIIIPLVLAVVVGARAYVGFGLRDVAIIGLPLALTIAYLFLGRKWTMFFTAFIVLEVVVIGIIDISKIRENPLADFIAVDDIIILPLLIIAIAAVLNALVIRLNIAYNSAIKNEEAQNLANEELHLLQNELEQRISERTQQLEKRAVQLQASVKITRAASAIKELDELLPIITKSISSTLNYYHVGIFLLNQQGDYAILRASNSTGGQKMIEENHHIQVGAEKPVGFVTHTGHPHIALDAGENAIRFDNPYLPETHSEIALPLIVNNKIIGALDVQSKKISAFNNEDSEILRALANQLAISIENAILFAKTERTLHEAQQAISFYVQEEWSSYIATSTSSSYILQDEMMRPLDEKKETPEFVRACVTGEVAHSDQVLAIPIVLRGETIGVIGIETDEDKFWTEDELSIARTAAERMAITLENARLLEDAQRRASREQNIGEFSASISAVSNVEAVLKTAVEELGQRLSQSSGVTIEMSSFSGKEG
ncbi:MAG: GAF domain-containing protein [Candidatus Hydrogenedentes bacterium]|nr:GAF domain-containing protein [Candidatus Hydrogenedentota bacterium]